MTGSGGAPDHPTTSIGQRRQQRAGGAHQRAGKAVAHKESRAVAVAHRLGQQGLFQRKEDADVAGRGIDAFRQSAISNKGQKACRPAKPRPVSDHQSGGGQKRPAMTEAAGDQPGKQRETRRAQQGRGGQDADLERIETERQEIGGQQDARRSRPPPPATPAHRSAVWHWHRPFQETSASHPNRKDGRL